MKNVKYDIREPFDFNVRSLNDSLFFYNSKIKAVPYIVANRNIKMAVHRQASVEVRFTLNNRNRL